MALQFTFGSVITVAHTDAQPSLEQKARVHDKAVGTTNSSGIHSQTIAAGFEIVSVRWTDDLKTKPQSTPRVTLSGTTLTVESSLGDQDPSRPYEVRLISAV